MPALLQNAGAVGCHHDGREAPEEAGLPHEHKVVVTPGDVEDLAPDRRARSPPEVHEPGAPPLEQRLLTRPWHPADDLLADEERGVALDPGVRRLHAQEERGRALARRRHRQPEGHRGQDQEPRDPYANKGPEHASFVTILVISK